MDDVFLIHKQKKDASVHRELCIFIHMIHYKMIKLNAIMIIPDITPRIER